MDDQINYNGFAISKDGDVTAKSLALVSAQPPAGSELAVVRRDLVTVVWSTDQAVAGSATGVHAAIVDNGATQSITTAISNPPSARCLSVTYGGTATDIKGGHQVTAVGLDDAGEEITEVLPAATANTANTVYGLKAFASVTSLSVPAHDGTGATTAVGYSETLGLPFKLSENTVLRAFLAGTPEVTAPTVTVSSSVLSLNTVDLSSALNGTAVKVLVAV